MGGFVEPMVFPIAETRSIFEGEVGMFNALDCGFQTDAKADGERLIEIAGKLCYMSFDTKLNKNLTKVGLKSNLKYIGNILEHKHGSVLEHSSVTMAMLNVSRVVTHELVRHRTGTAFSQLSGRYVRSDSVDMYLPSCIAEEPWAVAIFERAMVQMEQNVADLEAGFKINEMTDPKQFHRKKILTSAFRRLIGNGQANHIVVTGNHRAWRHMIEMRTSEGAEEEIRLTYNKVFLAVVDRYPAIYQDAQVIHDEDGKGLFQVKFDNSKV